MGKLPTLLGKAGDSAGLERTIKVNTIKTRTYSFFRQGVIYYQLLPRMKESYARLLMEKMHLLPEAASVIYPHTWSFLSL